jgi:hypothetical protein
MLFVFLVFSGTPCCCASIRPGGHMRPRVGTGHIAPRQQPRPASRSAPPLQGARSAWRSTGQSAASARKRPERAVSSLGLSPVPRFFRPLRVRSHRDGATTITSEIKREHSRRVSGTPAWSRTPGPGRIWTCLPPGRAAARLGGSTVPDVPQLQPGHREPRPVGCLLLAGSRPGRGERPVAPLVRAALLLHNRFACPRPPRRTTCRRPGWCATRTSGHFRVWFPLRAGPRPEPVCSPWDSRTIPRPGPGPAADIRPAACPYGRMQYVNDFKLQP